MQIIKHIRNFSLHHTFILLLSEVTLIVVALVLTSCNFALISTPTSSNSELDATSTATSVQFSLSTVVPPTLAVANPTPTSLSPTPYSQITTKNFRHPDDLYSLKIPDAWVISQDNSAVVFIDPNGKSELHVCMVHTGYPLDNDSFLRLIEVREENHYKNIDSSIEINRQVENEQGFILIEKQFISNSTQMNEITWYQQQDQVIFIMDFQSNPEDYGVLRGTFDNIMSSTEFHADSITSLDANTANDHILITNEAYNIQIPTYWTKTHSFSDFTKVDTFSSPDERAIIQIVIYDDGQEMSKTVAGDFVLYLLQKYYSNDLEITSDTVLTEGMEQLTWISDADNYQGITFFKTHDTTLLILTIFWDNDYKIYYEESIDLAIDSFSTP